MCIHTANETLRHLYTISPTQYTLCHLHTMSTIHYSGCVGKSSLAGGLVYCLTSEGVVYKWLGSPITLLPGTHLQTHMYIPTHLQAYTASIYNIRYTITHTMDKADVSKILHACSHSLCHGNQPHWSQ